MGYLFVHGEALTRAIEILRTQLAEMEESTNSFCTKFYSSESEKLNSLAGDATSEIAAELLKKYTTDYYHHMRWGEYDSACMIEFLESSKQAYDLSEERNSSLLNSQTCYPLANSAVAAQLSNEDVVDYRHRMGRDEYDSAGVIERWRSAKQAYDFDEKDNFVLFNSQMRYASTDAVEAGQLSNHDEVNYHTLRRLSS